MLQLFWPPSQMNSETKYNSFKRPNTELLESGKKFSVSSFWGWPHPLNWITLGCWSKKDEKFIWKLALTSQLLTNVPKKKKPNITLELCQSNKTDWTPNTWYILIYFWGNYHVLQKTSTVLFWTTLPSLFMNILAKATLQE